MGQKLERTLTVQILSNTIRETPKKPAIKNSFTRLCNINYNTNILRILHHQEQNKSSTLNMLRKISKPVTPFSTVLARPALFQATRGFPYAIVFMMLSLTFSETERPKFIGVSLRF